MISKSVLIKVCILNVANRKLLRWTTYMVACRLVFQSITTLKPLFRQGKSVYTIYWISKRQCDFYWNQGQPWLRLSSRCCIDFKWDIFASILLQSTKEGLKSDNNIRLLIWPTSKRAYPHELKCDFYFYLYV